MVATATERIAGTGLPLSFQVRDAHDLDFPDESFDRASASQMFSHVDDPARVLQEMVRVTRRGGRIVVSESHARASTFSGVDVQTTRVVCDAFARQLRNSWICLQMLQLFRDAGLADLTVEPTTITSRSLEAVLTRVPYREAVNRAIHDGMADAEQMTAWWRVLEEADRVGTFFWSTTRFTFAGRRP
jgi:ubiquinone/menaquinone biosynthesis C-methylase UbiE